MNKQGSSHIPHEHQSSKQMIARLEEEKRKSRLLFGQLEQINVKMRENYARSIESLSGGKLMLVTEEEIDALLGEPISRQFEVRDAKALSQSREIAARILDINFPGNRKDRCIIAMGEAMTNAAQHAGGGKFRFFRKGKMLQFMIEDSGGGIRSGLVPRAALTPGFSTVGTAGLGFSIMLEQCNRLYLSSKPGKTVLILEMEI